MDPEVQAAEAQPNGGAPESAPSPGQGEDAFQGLYDLSAAPEELRPLLEQELKKVDANVTRRFQEHADFRKKFEPLEGIDGLTDVSPDDLKELLQFREVAGDQEQFANWWRAVGQELGFLDDDALVGELGGEVPDGDVSKLVAEAVQQAVGPLAQRLEQFETQGQTEKAKAAAEQEIETQLDELREQHGKFDEALVRRLAKDYVKEPDFIKRGFEDYLRITGQAQSELVDDKLEQPDPATRSGRPDTAAEPITDWKQVSAAALQRLGG